MSPALSVLWNQHLLVLSFLKRRQLLKSRISTLSFWSPPLEFCRNRCLLLVFVTASPLPLFQWIEPTSISYLVYRFSSALCCSGSNRRLIVVPLSFPKLCRLQKHQTSSTRIGLTAGPLSFLSRLRVLYLPWAVFTPLPSCVGCVSSSAQRRAHNLLRSIEYE